MQQWYNLSDPVAEDALYEITSMHRFAQLSLSQGGVPDESTILKFRHLLEKHSYPLALLNEVNAHLRDKNIKSLRPL